MLISFGRQGAGGNDLVTSFPPAASAGVPPPSAGGGPGQGQPARESAVLGGTNAEVSIVVGGEAPG